ncbi:MAG: hypothetical protein Q4C96_04005 [Planctomycetia bacterium]|nr:hypothetical protein [Planctomycetia bacterium]
MKQNRIFPVYGIIFILSGFFSLYGGVSRSEAQQTPAPRTSSSAGRQKTRPVFPPRQLAPHVMRAKNPFLDFSETNFVHDIYEITVKKPEYTWAKNISYRGDIWYFDIEFKPMRSITLDIPDSDGRLKRHIIWYLIYKVRNPGMVYRPVAQTHSAPTITLMRHMKSLGSHPVPVERQYYEVTRNPEQSLRFIPNFELVTWDSTQYEPEKRSEKLEDLLPRLKVRIAELKKVSGPQNEKWLSTLQKLDTAITRQMSQVGELRELNRVRGEKKKVSEQWKALKEWQTQEKDKLRAEIKRLEAQEKKLQEILDEKLRNMDIFRRLEAWGSLDQQMQLEELGHSGQLKELERTLEANAAKSGMKPMQFNYLDRYIPLAVTAINRKEDPGRKIYDSIQMMYKEIKPGEEVWGVALWSGVNSSTDKFSVYVSGLTNAYEWNEDPAAYKNSDTPAAGATYRYKTLKLNYWCPGDETPSGQRTEVFRMGIPGMDGGSDYRWIYRAPKAKGDE